MEKYLFKDPLNEFFERQRSSIPGNTTRHPGEALQNASEKVRKVGAEPRPMRLVFKFLRAHAKGSERSKKARESGVVCLIFV
jgi:hypothetical protein